MIDLLAYVPMPATAIAIAVGLLAGTMTRRHVERRNERQHR